MKNNNENKETLDNVPFTALRDEEEELLIDREANGRQNRKSVALQNRRSAIAKHLTNTNGTSKAASPQIRKRIYDGCADGLAWAGKEIKHFFHSSTQLIRQHKIAFSLSFLSALVPAIYTMLKESGKTPIEAGQDPTAWWDGMSWGQRGVSLVNGVCSFGVNILFGTIYNIANWKAIQNIYNNFSIMSPLGFAIMGGAVVIGLSAAAAAGILSIQALAAGGAGVFVTVGVLNGISTFATRCKGGNDAGTRLHNKIVNCCYCNYTSCGCGVEKSIDAEFKAKPDRAIRDNLIKKLLTNLNPVIKDRLTTIATLTIETEQHRIEEKLLRSPKFEKAIQETGVEGAFKRVLKEKEETYGKRDVNAKTEIKKSIPAKHAELVKDIGTNAVKESLDFKWERDKELKSKLIDATLRGIKGIVDDYAKIDPKSIFKHEHICKTAGKILISYANAIFMALTVSLTFAQKGKEAAQYAGAENNRTLGAAAFFSGFSTSLFYFITGLDILTVANRTRRSLQGGFTFDKKNFCSKSEFVANLKRLNWGNIFKFSLLNGAIYGGRHSLTSVAAAPMNAEKGGIAADYFNAQGGLGKFIVDSHPVAVCLTNGIPTNRHCFNQPNTTNPTFYDVLLIMENQDILKEQLRDIYIYLSAIDRYGYDGAQEELKIATTNRYKLFVPVQPAAEITINVNDNRLPPAFADFSPDAAPLRDADLTPLPYSTNPNRSPSPGQSVFSATA